MSARELPDFDVRMIERYVENTYRRAATVFLGSVVAGVTIGAVFGAIPLTSLGASWPIPGMFGFATTIFGATLGGVVGYLIGDTRAFLARLQGQTALAQIHTAKDARLALDSIREIQALATRSAATSTRETQALAMPPPAPVATAPLVTAVRPPVVQSVPDPVPAAPQREPAPPASVQAAPPQLEAVPSLPAEPVPMPTLVVAGSAESAPPAPPLSS